MTAERDRLEAMEAEPVWISEVNAPLFKVENLDGVWWYAAPAPAAGHEHTAQTRWWRNLEYGERCACGAFRDRDGWFMLGRDRPRLQPLAPGLLRRLRQSVTRA